MSREPKANPQHGRKANQKMKPYLVMEYLMRHTDENHAESADNIAAYLQELGIDAERRSIYRDISRTTKSPPHSKTRSKMCLTVKQVSRKSPPLQNGETGLGASTVELI